MEEPFDVLEEPYILKEVSKIQAVNQLDDLVRQGAVTSEKATYAKKKYSELRNVYLSMLTTERTLISEVDEMEIQSKDLCNELGKILRDSTEDEETLDLVREDAEQAESEAQICREKEQLIVMEVTDLTRLQDLYKERIQEIEKEHAIAVAPLMTRYKLEIQGAKDTIADCLVKKEQYTEEMQNCKQQLQQALNDIQQIHTEKIADLTNLEALEGIPDKYHKQADILCTAIKALQLQDQKWSDKVKEVEAEIAGNQYTAKHLTEELAHAAIQIERNQLLCEQKERQAIDIAKDLEIATLEIDDYLADQVNVDMQLRSKTMDLKLEQDQLTTHTKEKDKILRRVKVEEQLVLRIGTSFPILIIEHEKVQSQVLAVENGRQKTAAMMDELRKEIDLQMHNLLAVETLGKEIVTCLYASHKQVAKLETHIANCVDIERLKHQHISNMTMMRERLCRQAAQKHHMWKDALKKLHMMDILVRNTQKRDLELEQQIKDVVLLYNVVRSQRNKFASLVQASEVSICELKGKLITIHTEVEALQSDVKYKDKILTKQRGEYQAIVRRRSQILSDMTKSALILHEAKIQENELDLKVTKLEGFVAASERKMVRTRKLYGLEVMDRNRMGLSLIDRNDELCILYEKANVQLEVLKNSEVEFHIKIDELRYLKIQSRILKQQILSACRAAPDSARMYDILKNLRQQLAKAKIASSNLSDLVESPENTSSWQLLPGRDLTDLELHLKMTAVDDFLSEKADQALEKEYISKEVTTLVDDLTRQAQENLERNKDYFEESNRCRSNMHSIGRRLMATISELSLCQTTILSMNKEKEQLRAKLGQASMVLAIGESMKTTPTKWIATNSTASLLLEWTQSQEYIRKTTAEQRPNAYIEEDLGLPKPFGLYAPFKPSDAGAQMRHFKNPSFKFLDT